MIMRQKTKKHRNIPIFIPHMGCPNMCVFCNQRSISGKTSFDRAKVRDEISSVLDTIPTDCEVEIAYFGGSFTGIDRELMIYLLDTAQSFINRDDGRARVTGIRMSTRPDYISEEILNILSGYSVCAIELGLQSMDDGVLAASKRGHTVAEAESACRMIVERGYQLVGQMMIGLPSSTQESEIYTAKRICELGATSARIYPTVVFYETELAVMAARGEYMMLDTDEAVSRSVKALEVFEQNGVECIRIGLCASDNLSDPSCVMGGASHPALGELVLGEYAFMKMMALVRSKDSDTFARSITFTVPRGRASVCIGQKGKNRDRLMRELGARRVIIKEGETSDIVLESID